MVWEHDTEIPPWRHAFIESLETIVDIVCLVNMADLVDMVSKYSRHSRQGMHSLAWDNKSLTILCVLKLQEFH